MTTEHLFAQTRTMALPVPLPPPAYLNAATCLYFTLLYQRKGDGNDWMFSVDRCHTTVSEANARLSLLFRCNTDPAINEILSAGTDPRTKAQWASWTLPGQNKPRFYGEVKQVIMHGSVRTEKAGERPQSRGGALDGKAFRMTLAEGKWLFEHKKDLANHVWVVAVHRPHTARYDEGVTEEDGRPSDLPWTLESAHPASGNALARGKRLWNEGMAKQHGNYDRLDRHYGFARYLLLPASIGVEALGKEDVQGVIESAPQIRVERLRVFDRGEGELEAWFAPAEAILFNKPFRPLCPGREDVTARHFEREMQALLEDAGETRASLEGEEDWDEYQRRMFNTADLPEQLLEADVFTSVTPFTPNPSAVSPTKRRNGKKSKNALAQTGRELYHAMLKDGWVGKRVSFDGSSSSSRKASSKYRTPSEEARASTSRDSRQTGIAESMREVAASLRSASGGATSRMSSSRMTSSGRSGGKVKAPKHEWQEGRVLSVVPGGGVSGLALAMNGRRRI